MRSLDSQSSFFSEDTSISSSSSLSSAEAVAVGATAIAISSHVIDRREGPYQDNTNQPSPPPVNFVEKKGTPPNTERQNLDGTSSDSNSNITARTAMSEPPEVLPFDAEKQSFDGTSQDSNSNITARTAMSSVKPSKVLPSGTADENGETSPLPLPKSRTASNKDDISFLQREKIRRPEDRKRDKKETKAYSWLQSQIAEIDEFYDMELRDIEEWETRKINKARSNFSWIERKLEEKKLRAQEKMRKEISIAYKKAERRRAKVNKRRAVEQDVARQVAQNVTRTGNVPKKYICC